MEMASESSFPNWLDLPPDVTASILQRLGAIEILEVAQKVCATWHKICKDPSMWRTIDMRDLNELNDDIPCDFDTTCRHAVDRSCGLLREINLRYYATDELLHYIADRAPHLRSLQLAICEISEEGFAEVVKKLPNLEELHIYSTPYSKEALESVGHCCPELKSLTYNVKGSRIPYLDGDGEALAIAQTMPGLNHLSLIGNQMTNVGLQAILNGCPHLESLDLRQCFFVDLGSAIGRICSQRIKKLKYPNDSTEDYEFDTDVEESEYSSHEEPECDYSLYDHESNTSVTDLIERGYAFGYEAMCDYDIDSNDYEYDWQFDY